jgi:uncharacterized protein (TIGR04255 family)
VTEAAEDPLRRRRYENPPVIEAVARFRWSEPIAWNVTIPGVLLEHLRDLYPGETKGQAILQAGMFSGAEGAEVGSGLAPGPHAGFQLRTGAQRILFSDEAGSRMLGVSAEDVSVHGTQPYEGWESLEQRLVDALERVNDALSNEVPMYSQVGLRYINKVEIPHERVRFEDHLTIGLSFPDAFPPNMSAFLERAEMQYPDEDVVLAFTWASTEAPKGCSAFVLDLDLVASLPEPVTLEQAREVLRDLKLKEGRAFEALLQDGLREQFVEIG